MSEYTPERQRGNPIAAKASGEVFISYASQDASVATAIVEALENAGVACWIAPRDVTPGDFYADAIVGAINASRVMVVVLTESAVASAHVLREVERASAKRHPVISFRIGAAQLPAGLEYFLSASHWLDAAASGVPASLPRLVEAVQRLVAPTLGASPNRASDNAKPPEALFPHTPAVKASWGVRRTRVTVFAVVAVVMAYLIVDRLWLSKHEAGERSAAADTAAATPAAAVISERSIAVLPFADMSEKHDQEYFSDGLSEELINHLAHNADLKVIARTSSFAFKGKNEDMRSIASKLGVANLLEGSVRKAGGTLRITAQLIRASDGVHLWSETFDRKLNDIFRVQDEISTTVAKALNAALNMTPALGFHSASTETTNMAAYNLVLEGNYLYWRGEKGDKSRAVEHFQQALKLDPRYATAWAKLARAYAVQANLGELTAAEAEVKGRDAVRQALAIDSNCAEAYFARGNIVRFIVGDWMAARSDYERAIALDPHGEVGEHAQGNILYINATMSGQYDGYIEWNRRQLERNPLDTGIMSGLAWMEQFAGRLHESAATSRKLLELNPGFATAQALYASTLLLMGKQVEALAAARKESDDASKLTALACIYWDMGRRAESDSALDALERDLAEDNEYLIASAHAYRGDADAALKWLDRAYRHRKGFLQDLRVDPFFRRLHADPRFNALLRKLNLPEY